MLKTIFYSLLLSSLFFSCTRATSEADMSQMWVSIPSTSDKLGSLSVSELKHVIINVTGEGLPFPILFEWDKCEYGCNESVISPDHFELNIPKGNNRLFQIIAAYEGDNGSAEFLYGDSVKTLSAPQETVDIPLNAVGTSTHLSTGKISGRYLDTATSGPTGTLLVKYYPPGGKPAMIIETSPIVSGWFSAFALKDIPLSYEMAGGQPLNGLSNIKLNIAFNLSSYVRVEMPPHYECRYENGAYVSNGEQRESKTYVYGYWGAEGVSVTQKACIGSITNLFKKCSRNADGTYSLLPGTAITYSGPNACAGNSYSDHLSVSTAMIENEQSAAGFYTPFKLDANSKPITITITYQSPNEVTVNYSLLPNTNEVISQVFIFKKTGVTSEMNFHKEGAPCAEIASGLISGFTEVSKVQVSQSELSYSRTFAVSPSDLGNMQLAICPLVNGKFTRAGIFLDRYHFFAPAPPPDPCLAASVTPGTVCDGGAIFIGSLSPGATSGSGTDKYMTTPGNCSDVPADSNRGGTETKNYYTTADFTPICDGATDTLTKSWNDGSANGFDIAAITNYTATVGTGQGAINTDANYGSSNTAAIVAITATSEGGYHAAARYCNKLSYGGYTDWYLPNRYELNLFYTNKASILGLDTSGNWYWSSSEYNSDIAWNQMLSNGYQNYASKYTAYRVRCVRRF